MAYNRKYFLEKVIIIQQIVIENKKKGCTQKWIYNNLIVDAYKISYSTFNNYLSINAKYELQKLLKNKSEHVN